MILLMQKKSLHLVHRDAIIRNMRLVDLQTVIKIEKECYPFPWTEGIFYDCIRVGYHCFVYCMYGEIYAYTLMSVAAGEAHILNICVAKKYQKQGIGRYLLDYLLVIAKQEKVTAVFLEVRRSNGAAIHLYQKYGFKNIAVRKNYYPNGKVREDALIFSYQCIDHRDK